MKAADKKANEMTLRESFVMAAMQGLCANGDARNFGSDWISVVAVQVADKTISKMEDD
jgi:hypothetical protein